MKKRHWFILAIVVLIVALGVLTSVFASKETKETVGTGLNWLFAAFLVLLVFVLATWGYLRVFSDPNQLARTRKSAAPEAPAQPAAAVRRAATPAAPPAKPARIPWLDFAICAFLAIEGSVTAYFLVAHFHIFDHARATMGPHRSAAYSSAPLHATPLESLPEKVVQGEADAPPNGSYDFEDDDKTMEGTFTAPVNLIDQHGHARKICFTDDLACPSPNPADVPWVMKCWPVGGGDPFIWNGSNAVAYDHCSFSSKTDQPVNIPYWLVPS